MEQYCVLGRTGSLPWIVPGRHGLFGVLQARFLTCPISALCSKKQSREYPGGGYFFACLGLEQKSSFLNGHESSF